MRFDQEKMKEIFLDAIPKVMLQYASLTILGVAPVSVLLSHLWKRIFLLRAQEEPATSFARHISILEEICSAKINR